SSYYIYNDASDIISDDIKSYSYDSLARLTTANSSLIGPLSESYSYDKTGNRIKNNISTGVINYTTNNLDQYTLLTGSILSGSITYDNNGNLKINTNRTYIYDYNNRLIQVNIGTGILAKYKYDILGRRTQKIDYSKSSTNPESTLYVYSQNNIISEYRTIGVATGSGGTGVLTPLTLKKNYINGIGTDALIAYEVEEQLTATGLTKTTNRYYYHLNQLGSVVAISTQAGNMPRTFGYDAFGKAYILGEKTITEATYKDISSYTGTLYGNTRLYTGREYDQETGLYYNRARYYNPDTGRFLSRDPIGQNDQINLYTYVANNPLKYVDRMGLEKVLILIGEDFIGGANSILIQETLKIEKSRLFVKGIKDKNIVIKNINSVSGFNDGLNQAYLFKYSGVIGLFHGNRNGISITKNEIIDNNTLKNLSVPSDFDIPIRLDSCDTGFSGLFSDGIAGKLAKTLGTTVSAPNKTLGVDTANSDFIIGDEKYISGKRRGDSDLILSISTSGPGKWNTFNY
ncbi:RHS repeat-associated core domain-containing protein, partial [Candidatus Gracilibacteria bacterium]|nr:RHS repeat-associated core domain-containing protein [Candidatus Gracilibacteria bacterium]